jgi:hypothetical protein
LLLDQILLETENCGMFRLIERHAGCNLACDMPAAI